MEAVLAILWVYVFGDFGMICGHLIDDVYDQKRFCRTISVRGDDTSWEAKDVCDHRYLGS